MTFAKISFFLVWFALSLSACSGGDLAGQTGSDKGKKEDSSEDSDEELEQDDADPPQEIAGAHLVGNCDKREADEPNAKVKMGCVVLTSDTKVKAADVTVSGLVMSFDDRPDEAQEFAAAEATGPWHIHFEIDADRFAHAKTAKLTLAGQTTSLDVDIVHSAEVEEEKVAAPPGKIFAFISRKSFKPGSDFKSMTEADELCADAADDSAALKEVKMWTALLTVAGKDIKTRWKSNGPIFDVKGQELAASDEAFWKIWQAGKTVFDMNEHGEDVGLDQVFWTGEPKTSLFDADNVDCVGWTSKSLTKQGVVGGRSELHEAFDKDAPCHEAHHLFCIGQ